MVLAHIFKRLPEVSGHAINLLYNQ